MLKDCLILFSAFARLKVVNYAKLRIIDHASGVWPPVYLKLGVNWKIDDGIIICRHDVIVKPFLTLSCFPSHV